MKTPLRRRRLQPLASGHAHASSRSRRAAPRGAAWPPPWPRSTAPPSPASSATRRAPSCPAATVAITNDATGIRRVDHDQRRRRVPRRRPRARRVPGRDRRPPASRPTRSWCSCRPASAAASTCRSPPAASTRPCRCRRPRRCSRPQAAALGTVVSRTEIANLPLAIRNWDDLLFTIPGVQGDRYTEQTGTTNAGRTGGVSIHGNRSLQNNFLLDGVDNNSISTNVQELSTQVSRPSIDAIDEFKVVTSPFAAEYGRAPGGAIVVTHQVGHQPHLRHRLRLLPRRTLRLERTFFAKRQNLDKPANDQNQFGFNLGGPILRNKAFFFGDFEATRITQGVLRTGRVATADERNGVFSSAIRDPLTGLPFPNNTIPANRIDPVARAIMAPGAAAERHRQQQLHPPAERRRQRRTVPVPRRRQARRQRQPVRALHLRRPHPLRARLLRRRRRRHVHVGLGPQLPQVAQHGRPAGPRCSAPRSSTRSACRGRAASPTASRIRSVRTAGRRCQGVPNDPVVAGGVIGIDIAGPPAHRLAELHAEVPAHRPGAVPQHAVVAARAATR